MPVILPDNAAFCCTITYANAAAGSRTMAVGTPGVGGPFTLLICERWPLPRSRLKLCITADPCVGTTTKPLSEEEYLVLQAIRKAIAVRTRIATIQVNRFRILALSPVSVLMVSR